MNFAQYFEMRSQFPAPSPADAPHLGDRRRVPEENSVMEDSPLDMTGEIFPCNLG